MSSSNFLQASFSLFPHLRPRYRLHLNSKNCNPVLFRIMPRSRYVSNVGLRGTSTKTSDAEEGPTKGSSTSHSVGFLFFITSSRSESCPSKHSRDAWNLLSTHTIQAEEHPISLPQKWRWCRSGVFSMVSIRSKMWLHNYLPWR